MTNTSYDVIERSFSDLLDSIATTFTEQELCEIREFLDATEYGLALQTFVDIVVEEKKHIPRRTAAICDDLVKLMGLAKEIDMRAVHAAVS